MKTNEKYPDEQPVCEAAREEGNSALPLPWAHHLVPFLKWVGPASFQHDTITETAANINCVRHCAKCLHALPTLILTIALLGKFRYSCSGGDKEINR